MAGNSWHDIRISLPGLKPWSTFENAAMRPEFISRFNRVLNNSPVIYGGEHE